MKQLILKSEIVSDHYFVRESFNIFRTNVLFSGVGKKVILFTSCYSNEGKSTVSLELAASLAKVGKKTLFVDADMRKSILAVKMEAPADKGLSELISGQVPEEEAVYETNFENLYLVPTGAFPPNPAELCGAPEMKAFLEKAKKEYDYVIVDAPPLGMVIDSAVLAAHCDGAVLVIRKGTVRIKEEQRVLEQLKKSNCPILGAVFNDIEAKKKKHKK